MAKFRYNNDYPITKENAFHFANFVHDKTRYDWDKLLSIYCSPSFVDNLHLQLFRYINDTDLKLLLKYKDIFDLLKNVSYSKEHLDSREADIERNLFLSNNAVKPLALAMGI